MVSSVWAYVKKKPLFAEIWCKERQFGLQEQ